MQTDCRQLITERFAATGRHYSQHVASCHCGFHDSLLVISVLGVTEGLEESGKWRVAGGFGMGYPSWPARSASHSDAGGLELLPPR